MSSNTPAKSKHLALVKEGRLVSEGKILSPENLTSDQRRVVDRYIATCQSGGVLVGILSGDAGWDLRPLLLESGSLVVVRFSDPALALHTPKLNALRDIYTRIQSGGSPSITCGEGEGQLWVKRSFYQGTLEDSAPGKDEATHPIQIIQRLVNTLQTQHNARLIHGHVSLANIALDEGVPTLLDHGFCALAVKPPPARYDIAPELELGRSPTVASDIYGLGVITKRFLQEYLSGDLSKLIERTLSPDPSARPTLKEIEEALSPRDRTALSDKGHSAVSRPTTARSGKLLNMSTVATGAGQQPIPAPIPPAPISSIKSYSSPQKIIIQPQQDSAPSSSTTTFAYGNLLLGLLVVACIAVVLFRFYPSQPSDMSFDLMWASNQPSLMKQVAESAIKDNDSLAQLTIVSDILKGSSRPRIRSNLVRIAFNPAWEAELMPNDKQVALSLALAPLIPELTGELPNLSTLHPAVVLALLGEIDPPGKSIGIPLSKLQTLAAPYGPAFQELEKAGVQDMGEGAAVALCHILVGNTSRAVMDLYFSPDDKPQFAGHKLRMLLALLGRHPGLEKVAIESLAAGANPLNILARWFDGEKLSKWGSVDERDKLLLIGGVPIKTTLTFEQYADLLRFPTIEIRRDAAQRLLPALSAKASDTLFYLVSTKNRLTRMQTILLLSAFRLQGEQLFAAIDSWFKTKPDAQSVLGLLLARTHIDKLDPFSIEAVRYLKNTSWSATREELRTLISHPEPLARALAYARLNAGVRDERKILETAVAVEPLENLKRELKEKLGSAAK